MNRPPKSYLLAALLAGFVGATAASLVPSGLGLARAQESPPEVGRYQISSIRGAVYMLDTRTAEVWVWEYQTKRWASVGNPLTDSEGPR